MTSGDIGWRAGQSTARIAWLNFLTEVVFGTAYDAPLKVALKEGLRPEDAIEKEVFAMVVESIEDKVEKKLPTRDEED